MNTIRICAILSAVLIGAVVPVAEAAEVCQSFNCYNIIYYENANKEKVVGVQSTCPGWKGLQGRRTRWFDREADSYRICSNVPGKIPCEFTPKGCGNLPQPR